VLLISGCAGIPTSSEVKYGDEFTADVSAQFVRVIARPPSRGMEPAALVQGFLDASADPSDDFAIARQYLTSDSADTWSPDGGIEIYDGTELQLEVAGDRINGSGFKVGEVTVAGRYELAPTDTKINASFTVSKDSEGEWRISDLKDGLYLSSGDVERSYRSFPVYFFNQDLTELVTDSVLVPVGSNGAATTLVRSLLNGPSSYLLLATKNAFPSGTRLTYGSVPINNGQAQVDLSAEVLGADELTRRAISAQLVWTLSSLPNVTSVRITVSGQPLAMTDIGNVQTLDNWSDLSPSENPGANVLSVIRGNQIVKLTEADNEIQIAGGTQLLGTASLNKEGNRIAATSDDGTAILATNSNDGTFSTVAIGSKLSRPSWDPANNLMFADFGKGVLELGADGNLHSVALELTSLGTANQIRQVALARDGVRIALVISSGLTDVLAVGSVVRNETGVRIVGIHRVERNINLIRDVSWKSPTGLMVLGGDTEVSDQLFTVSLMDGQVIGTKVPVGAQSLIVDGSGQVALSVNDLTEQSVFVQKFGTWTETAKGITAFFSK
jgi:hypothetical protein